MRTTVQVRVIRALVVSAIAAGIAQAQQEPAPGALRQTHLYEAVSSKTLSNVNRRDAEVALKLWAELMGQRRGFLLDSRVEIIDSVGELAARLESHSVDAMAICVTEFLELWARHPVIPVFTTSRTTQGETRYSYVLVVKSLDTTNSIAGLRGKNVLVSSRTLENTGIAWLDVMLGKERLGRASSFFGSLKTTDRSQGCILPVFFGTADACVVDEPNLDLAKEMNPQLGQLKVLARSRPMLEDIIATPTEPHPYLKEWKEAMLSAQNDPRGRQILTVFKARRVELIQPGDLDSAVELWRDYFRLPGAIPNKTPVAPRMIGQIPTR